MRRKVEKWIKERRGAIITVDEYEIISLFPKEDQEEVMLPILSIPKDVFIKGVWPDYRVQGFRILIYHGSLPKVPEAEEFTEIALTYKCHNVFQKVS